MKHILKKYWDKIRCLNKKAILAVISVFVIIIAASGFVLIAATQGEGEDIGNVKVQSPRDEYAELKKEFGEITITNPEILVELGLDESVRLYLKKNVAFSSFGDEVFCSYELFGIVEYENESRIYLWAYCGEVYVAHGTLKQGGGFSSPLSLVVKNENGIYKVVDHILPEEGSGYYESVKVIFPEEYHAKIFPDAYGLEKHNKRVRRLSYEVYTQGADFYQLP